MAYFFRHYFEAGILSHNELFDLHPTIEIPYRLHVFLDCCGIYVQTPKCNVDL